MVFPYKMRLKRVGESVPVDHHLNSNVLEEEPEGAKQRRLPSHPSQAVLPAH